MGIDLQKYIKYYDVKYIDGTDLHLKTPTQGIMNRCFNLLEAKEADVTYDTIVKLFVDILNNNREKFKVPKEDYDNFSIEMMYIVISEYMEFFMSDLGE